MVGTDGPEVQGAEVEGAEVQGAEVQGAGQRPPWRGPGVGYSGKVSPEPPTSFGKSLNFGRPSRIGSTVSA